MLTEAVGSWRGFVGAAVFSNTTVILSGYLRNHGSIVFAYFWARKGGGGHGFGRAHHHGPVDWQLVGYRAIWIYVPVLEVVYKLTPRWFAWRKAVQ